MAYLKRSVGTVTGQTSDSPVLTTPALGTPASGVMTNMTGAVTASLVNDAVTLAKMASGTDGNIISYDASGNPVAIATGSDGEVLTSAGAGAQPAFETAASGANTPAFAATYDLDVALIQGVNSVWADYANLEIFDTDGCYVGGTDMKFTPDEAGYYFIQGFCSVDDVVDGGNIAYRIMFNTTVKAQSSMRVGFAGGTKSQQAVWIGYFNGSDDYAQGQFMTQFGSQATKNIIAIPYSLFHGFKIAS